MIHKPGLFSTTAEAGFLALKSVKNAALLEVEDSETRLFRLFTTR
jgi:hypothetical protein